MICKLCKEKVVYKDFCKDHFVNYFENKVIDTIKNYDLINKKDKVAVAVSGGKDSLAVLNILHKFNYNVSALAIDEGIKGYRNNTLHTLTVFCKNKKINLRIFSFKQNFGKGLDSILANNSVKPCTVCGVFRRYLLNSKSKNYDVLATGHNLDDEAQAIIMNLLKGSISMLKRQGPVSGAIRISNFTKRVKPLYFCLEKEVMVYAFLNKLTTNFSECPNVNLAFRLKVRDFLNELELKKEGSKINTVNWMLNYKKNVNEKELKVSMCISCKEPSSNKICNACKYEMAIKNVC